MCEVSGKLIAWMDGELAEQEAAGVELHVRDCSECRSRVESFGEVSRLVVTYCAAVAEAPSSRKLPRWVPALAGAVAIAATLLFVFRPTTTTHPVPEVARAVEVSPARAPVVAPVLGPQVVSAPTRAKANPVHRQHHGVTRNNSTTDWASANPAFQIVIPAESMFAPGAFPEGTVFRANLSMASDGSVQGLRLLQ